MRLRFPLCVLVILSVLAVPFASAALAADGNRFAHLDECNPYSPSQHFPRLVTPQWVGEDGVEAVVVLAIDDMRDPAKYEAFLRPILQRLKRIDGRAALSIMTCNVKPDDPQLKAWLDEGLSLEVHTVDHLCPLLQKGDFAKAKSTYDRCVDLLGTVPGNAPVAFRMPCCDSLNTVSPRFFAEIFNKTTSAGRFLQIDSSVFHLFTDEDPRHPHELLMFPGWTERFGRYVPRDRKFINLIENSPYPYVIDRLCWEFPCAVPSDWSAQHFHKPNNPDTVADWNTALDLTVKDRGVMNLVFHPHGWIKNDQIVALIDHAVATHGNKVKFLTFREALDRINKHLLDGNPLRDAAGGDNGVRILDVNNDGYMDVVVANAKTRLTRIWSPESKTWTTAGFPTRLDAGFAASACFGVLGEAAAGPTSVVGPAAATGRSASVGGWDFNGKDWNAARWFDGLSPFLRSADGDPAQRPRLTFRDLDGDGRCEAIVADARETAFLMLNGNADAPKWQKAGYALPAGVAIADSKGNDAGLRFVDVDDDGDLDVLASNADGYALSLFESVKDGWTTPILSGRRGAQSPGAEIPMIVRADGTNNGTWFRDGHLWVQNEDTAIQKDLIDSRAADEWLKNVAVGPLSPQRSLQAIRTRPGFTVELVAAEPLVVDPVAFEWGSDGKLWVAEMGDYPSGVDGNGTAGGRVKFLEDTDGDGRYDKGTLFLGDLNFPNGVLPWKKGVLVTAAPDILYAEDADGDGKADVREVLYHGFGEGNQQHRVNGLVRGLDGWIYCANGDSGGTITSTKTGNKVGIDRRDFRIRPSTGEIETEFGSTQFLRSRNDWGDWFGNNNANPLWQYVLESRYLQRNRLGFAARATRDVSVAPGPSRCYPISRTERRFNDFAMANHFTSACSAMIYGDALFGAEFEGNSFVSEPVHHLVHREVMKRDGILWTSRRADDEQQSEFLASRDDWFRPTMLKVGPDGALYVADMYRKVIEHPQYIPKRLQQGVDFRAGSDRGRIYRVFPKGKTLRKTPGLVESSTPDLVAALDSRNLWQRDTAQQVLIDRNDSTAVPLLKSLATEGKLPQGRLHALWTLHGLNALAPDVLMRALADPHGGVRKNALRLSEAFFGDSAPLAEAAIRCALDPEAPVQLQAAYALGAIRGEPAVKALGSLAVRHADDSHFAAAVLSSLSKANVDQVVTAVFSETRSDVPELLVRNLLNAAVFVGDDRSLAAALAVVNRSAANDTERAVVFARLAAVTQSLDRLGKSLDRLGKEGDADVRREIDRLNSLFDGARGLVKSATAPETVRVAAVKVLGLREKTTAADVAVLADTLAPQTPVAVQTAAVDRLSEIASDDIPARLLKGWKSHRPAVRDRIIEALLRRRYWTRALLDAVENRSVGAGEINAAHWQELLHNAERSHRERAEKLLAGSIDANRQAVIDRYHAAVTIAGDAVRGKPLFLKHCGTCHKLGDVGQNTGPDLASRKDRSPEALLIALLDPSRNVESKYVAYVAVTRSGRSYTGILADESADGLVLVGPKAERVELLRDQIEELTSTSKSLMPDGLEKDSSPEALADVIAYVRGFDAPQAAGR